MGNLSSCIKGSPEDQQKADSKDWASEDPFSITKVTPKNTINEIVRRYSVYTKRHMTQPGLWANHRVTLHEVGAYLASPGWTGVSVVPEFITGQLLRTP
ncbi:uncharacterized protein [Macaca fascicularis]|uniref:uncharacterized protein n=1 Tax=Macaca fascicularis TaxID=9541 RepID=UPI0032B0879C